MRCLTLTPHLTESEQFPLVSPLNQYLQPYSPDTRIDDSFLRIEQLVAAVPWTNQCDCILECTEGRFLIVAADSQPRGVLAFSPLRGSRPVPNGLQKAKHICAIVGLALSQLSSALRKRQLQDTVRMLVGTQEMTNVGIWEYDVATDVTRWSKEMFSVMEYDINHGVPQLEDVLSRYPPEELALREERFTRCNQTGDVVIANVRTLMPDGRDKWQQVFMRSELDSSGSVIRMYGATRDITQRKRIEQELERQAQIIEESDDFIASATIDGYFIYCNKTARRMLGVTEAEVGTKHVRDLHSPESWANYSPNIPTLLETGCWSGEFEYLTQDGKRVPMWVKVIVHRTASGQMYRSAVARDISSRKQRERQLETARLRLSQALEIAQIGSWELDVASGKVWVSEEFCKITGIGEVAHEMCFEELLLTFPERSREKLRSNVNQSTLQGTPYEIDVTRTLQTGLRYFRGIGRPVFDETDNVAKIIHTCADVTDRRELESQLLQAQKLDSLGTFAGAIAHDFNNILAIIQGYTEQVMSELPPNHQSLQSLDSVMNASARAASLTQRLLAFANKQVIAPKVVSPAILIAGLAPMLKQLLGIRVLLSLELDLNPATDTVWIDPGQLEQVIVNLVANAKDALPGTGNILIQTTTTKLSAANRSGDLPDGDYIQISVIDDGAGMTPEVKLRIFDPFFTTKPKGKGTGLGLAIVYSIVRQNLGAIYVDSSPHEGAAFHILLPRFKVSEQRGTEELLIVPEWHKPTSKKRILVVDDEQMIRTLTATTLKNQGYEVLEAIDGKAAIDLLEGEEYAIDLLITDVMMPRIGGIDLANTFQSQRPDAVILLISGFSEEHFTGDMGTSAFPLIQKPFKMKRLAEVVAQLLSGAS